MTWITRNDELAVSVTCHFGLFSSIAARHCVMSCLATSEFLVLAFGIRFCTDIQFAKSFTMKPPFCRYMII